MSCTLQIASKVSPLSAITTPQTICFKRDQVNVLDSPIGKLVTVTLRLTPDSGSTQFALLVPDVNLTAGSDKRANIETVGITTYIVSRLSRAYSSASWEPIRKLI